MFARAARFPAEKDDGLPGPGAFDPRSPERKKRGAFLDSHEQRFKPARTDDADNFGAYGTLDIDKNPLTKSRARAASMSGRNDQQKLDALRMQLTAQHAREIKILEQQLAKQTKGLQALRDAETALRKEAKLRAASEATVKAELKHATQQLSMLPSLKTKFIDLVEEHANSKMKYAASMDSLRSDLADTEKRLKRSQAEEARLQAENLAKSREVGRLGDELGKVRAEKSKVEDELKTKEKECDSERAARAAAEERCEALQQHYEDQLAWARGQTAVLSAHASAAMTAQRQRSDNKLADVQLSALAAQHRALRSDRKMAEKEDQVARLVELVIALEEEKAFLEEQVEDLQEEVEQRNLLRLQDANLWRAHCADRADRNAEAGEDLSDVREDTAVEASAAAAEIEWLSDTVECGKEQIAYLSKVEEEAVALSLERTELAQETASLRTELESAYTTVSERDETITSAEAALAGSQDQVAALQGDLQTAQAQYADLQSEYERATQQLETALQQLQVYERQNEALSAEVAGLHEDLIDYLTLQETHGELCKTIERLTRTSSLAQEDADELARINAELVGHTNPSQKIRHLDRLRNDLAEIKRKHVATLAELTAAQKQVANLQSEIAAYKSVDGVPSVKHLQSSRLGPGRSVLGAVQTSHIGIRGGNTEGLNRFQLALAAKGGLRLSKQRSLHDLR